MMEMKECELCGGWFFASHKSRKYCDKCKDNPNVTRTRDNMIKRTYKTKARTQDVEDELNCQSFVCPVCNREFKVPPKFFQHLQDSDTGEVCCCKEHLDAWKRKHIVCEFCGKSLEGTEYYAPSKNKFEKVCDAECMEKLTIRRLEEAGFGKNCPNCGKYFVHKTKKYCSVSCFREYAHTNGKMAFM